MRKLPFPRFVSVYPFPLEIVHSNVWGRASEPSSDGYKYYISFVDDMSHYTWFFTMIRKIDVFDIFVRFQPSV